MLKQGDKLQLERRGYYIVDTITPRIVLFSIPDGRSKTKHLSAKSQWLETNQNHTKTALEDAMPHALQGGGLTLEQKRAFKKEKKMAQKVQSLMK